MRPYTPLELAGRDIYIREGCYVCHSQMIRPMRDEVERYGHYSLAAESMYDHPFQWGSKRTGPDLARVGGRYSDEWHVQHLTDPRSLVPTSIMPPYGHLVTTLLDTHNIAGHLATNAMVGVPYTEEMIENAERRSRRPGRPECRQRGSERALRRQGQDRPVRRRSQPDHRDGRAGRLSPDARHHGRLHGLRAALRRQPAVTP